MMCIHRCISVLHNTSRFFHCLLCPGKASCIPTNLFTFKGECRNKSRMRIEKEAVEGQPSGLAFFFFVSSVHAPYCHEPPHSLELKPQLALRNPLWFFLVRLPTFFQIMYSCLPDGLIIFFLHISPQYKKMSSSPFALYERCLNVWLVACWRKEKRKKRNTWYFYK